MATPGTYTRLIRDLSERLSEAEVEARESHKAAMNSYGAGYDRGYADAIREILVGITGEPAAA